MESIQRGDQVSYRGEVWEVWDKYRSINGFDKFSLRRPANTHSFYYESALIQDVQRVEQVR